MKFALPMSIVPQKYSPTWSTVSALMRTRVSQVAATIPLIGYAIIWSEKFSEWTRFPHGLEEFAWLTPYVRLHLLFFGAILLTIALIIFRTRCSLIVRRHPDITDYLVEMKTLNSPTYGKDARAEVRKQIDVVNHDGRGTVLDAKWKETAPDILKREPKLAVQVFRYLEDPSPQFRAYYLLLMSSHTRAMKISLSCWVTGFLLVVTPSIDTIQMVIRRMFS